jgi:Caspase domain/WD domain, G-beta repeat
MAPGDMPVFVPAPDFPSGPRSALIIATASYADAKLRQLRSPVKDAEDLAAVLGDPAMGGFKITALIDQTESRIRREIAAFLAERSTDETVLVYLSCHGIQDPRGRLLFAATDTETKYPHASAVRAAELLDELDECRARRQILVLDCCFSGSFSDGKGGHKGELDLERQLRGHSRGREVLTASRAFEFSFEGEPLDDAITGSVFTTGLVEGIRTGAADTDKNGQITVEEGYAYAFAHVLNKGAAQTPQRWLSGGEGTQIVLARSPLGRAVTPAKLPEHVTSVLESPLPNVRIGGVNAVAEWLADPDPARQMAALRALEEVAENDIRKVAQVAGAYLTAARPSAAAAPARAPSGPGGSPIGSAAGARWESRNVVAILEGHTDAVYDVCFSPDGALIATVGSDCTVRLWMVASGRQVRVLEGHHGAVWRVCFSPDGSQIATASSDRTVRVWDVASGGEVRVLRRHAKSRLAWQAEVYGVASSPDGALLASAVADRTVRVWDMASGTRLYAMEGHTEVVLTVDFSPRGALLASASQDGTARIWDTETGHQTHILQGHTGHVYGVSFSPDGASLATAGQDRTARLWDAASGRQTGALEGHTSVVGDVAFSPDGVLLATASNDKTVCLWNAATLEPLQTLHGHTDAVYAVAFSPTEPLLASAGVDKTVRLWR